MLESVREIHGHVNKQPTNHSSATEREIAEDSTRQKLGNSIVRQAVFEYTHRLNDKLIRK